MSDLSVRELGIKRDIRANRKWHKEMNEQGCSVVEPRRLGEQPAVVPKRFKECPTITIDGVVYRDTTSLLFEETKYKKFYSDQEEYDRIMKYERRKQKMKNKKRELNRSKKQQELETEELKSRQHIEENKKYGHISNYTINNKELSQFEIAEALGVRIYVIKTVRKELVEKGLVEPLKRKALTDKEVKSLVKLYKDGKTYQEISRIMGRPYGTIANRVYRCRDEGLLEPVRK